MFRTKMQLIQCPCQTPAHLVVFKTPSDWVPGRLQACLHDPALHVKYFNLEGTLGQRRWPLRSSGLRMQ
jgi:hypothetical protein